MLQFKSFLLVLVLFLQGCAYGLYEDKRLMDTIQEDKTLSTEIKSALLGYKFSEGFSVSVYSYYQHVFLVGKVPSGLQSKFVSIARSKHPLSVTPHWFAPATSPNSDTVVATRLRMDLIKTKGLSSTRIDTEVNSGRAVLLGVVGSENEKKLAINTANKVKGVTSVTSYLMLPQDIKKRKEE